ncbi:uncharacterized protein LOC134995897 isoform X3 [Pseudophryne corroboree]|uniref:uncharacterized protein LOC134995897 isoform X3 n=1 Tax=Pseudophryne corroboree TaxID=495146 RepID=UPI003081DB13
MEVQVLEHIRHSLLSDRNKDLIIDKLLSLTMEIICLLTREDFIVVRKSGDQVTDISGPPVSDRSSSTQRPNTEAPPPAPTGERSRDRITQPPTEVYHRETGKVPGKCKDVDVSFSVTEWDYSDGYKDVVMDPPQLRDSVGECSSRSPPGRCETPLYSGDYIKEENRIVIEDYQAEPGHGVYHPQCKEEEPVPDPTSSGGCSSRTPADPCETPLYSPGCIEEENRTVTQEYQADPGPMIYHRQCKEEAIPAEISPVSSNIPQGNTCGSYGPRRKRVNKGRCNPTHPAARCKNPLYSLGCMVEENRMISQDFQAMPGDGMCYQQCKEEAIPAEIGSGTEAGVELDAGDHRGLQEFLPESSAGGCSSRTPADPCETPLYSPGCIEEENRTVTQEYQDEPGHVIYHRQCKEEAVPAEISPGGCNLTHPADPCDTPLYTPGCMGEENRMISQDYQAVPGDGMCYQQCKEEDVPAEIRSGTEAGVELDAGDHRGLQEFLPESSAGGCSSRTPADPCETPLYSPGCIEEENRTVTQEYQDEPGHVIYHRQCKEEAVPAEISPGGCNPTHPADPCDTPLYTPGCMGEENRMISQDYQAVPGDGMCYQQCKEEDVPAEIRSGTEAGVELDAGDHRGLQEFLPESSAGGCSSRTPADPCETPLYSPGCIEEENRTVTQEYQDEPGHVIYHRQCKEEAVPAEISPGGCNPTHPADPCDTPLYTPGCMGEENRMISQDYQAVPGDGMCYQQCKEEDVPAEIRSGTEAGVELDAGDHRGLQEFLPESSAGPHASAHYPEKMHQCSECQQCYPNHSALVTHQQTHSASNLYRCSVCGVRFTSKLALAAHQRCHKEYKLSHCYSGKSFHQRSRLQSHKSTHTEERPFPCSECGRCFTNQSTLTKHQRLHSSEKLFKCYECSKCFVHKVDLVQHQRTHSGERPFLCLECGSCFKFRSALTMHQRIHSGERPFSCIACGKCFVRKGDLVRHQRTHTRERPYVCFQCSRCFSTSSHLSRHQEVHTGLGE